MQPQILDAEQARRLAEERRQLDSLRTALTRFEASRDDLEVLRQAQEDLDELFRLVIVGEFNAGKSALINALVGEAILEEGVTPTTAVVTLLRYGESQIDRMLEPELRERTFPSPFLREISIVDTPGTNAVIRRHQQLTEHFVPRSDLVLFVTSADRPFTETERSFLELIRNWGKKIVIALNKRDLVERPEELNQIEAYIAENAKRMLGIEPPIFAVSARQARRADAIADPEERKQALNNSGFPAFQQYLFETLEEPNRVRLKLLSPIGVADRLLDRYLKVAEERISLLNEDFKTAEQIDRQVAAHREDLEREFKPRLAEVENIIHETNARGVSFFEETIRIGRIFDLFNSARIREAFQQEVLAGTAERIDQTVEALIDWLMDRDLRLWNAVMEYLNRRRQPSFDDQIVGQVGGGFDYSRRDMLRSISRRVEDVIASYDREREARHLGESVRNAVTHTAIAELGAVGLGTAIAVLIGTAAADVTGILAGTIVAGLGLFIIPARRKQATAEFLKKTEALYQRLSDAITDQFRRETVRSEDYIREAIAPYVRFVRTEHERVTAVYQELELIRGRLRMLRTAIESGASLPPSDGTTPRVALPGGSSPRVIAEQGEEPPSP